MRIFSIALTKIAKFSGKNQHQIDNYPFFQEKTQWQGGNSRIFQKKLDATFLNLKFFMKNSMAMMKITNFLETTR